MTMRGGKEKTTRGAVKKERKMGRAGSLVKRRHKTGPSFERITKSTELTKEKRFGPMQTQRSESRKEKERGRPLLRTVGGKRLCTSQAASIVEKSLKKKTEASGGLQDIVKSNKKTGSDTPIQKGSSQKTELRRGKKKEKKEQDSSIKPVNGRMNQNGQKGSSMQGRNGKKEGNRNLRQVKETWTASKKADNEKSCP